MRTTLRICAAIAALALSTFAQAATTSVVTYGDWPLYRGASIVSRHASEAACIAAAKALNVTRNYTCRTTTGVSVTVTVDPPPPVAVNCAVSGWSAWVEISRATVGTTITITEQRTRTVVTPASNGGTPCPALLETQVRTETVAPPPVTGAEWLDPFTYPTEVPATFTSPNWNVQRYSRDRETWDVPEMMHADHGSTTCGGPPENHMISSYDDLVFRCKDHVMTAVKATGYGAIILTPNRMLDWAAGPADLEYSRRAGVARPQARDPPVSHGRRGPRTGTAGGTGEAAETAQSVGHGAGARPGRVMFQRR